MAVSLKKGQKVGFDQNKSGTEEGFGGIRMGYKEI